MEYSVIIVRCLSGSQLTPSIFNKTLRTLISPHVGHLSAEYSSHSFRAAISSALAKFPLFVSEDEIKCWGRRESSAFLKVHQARIFVHVFKMVTITAKYVQDSTVYKSMYVLLLHAWGSAACVHDEINFK